MPSQGSDKLNEEAQQDEWLFKHLLDRGRAAWMIADGRSMWPVFRGGAKILIDPNIPFEEIRVGDLVLAYTPNGLRCHRVLTRTDSYLHLKGDSLIWDDPLVGRDDVWGTVSEVAQRPSRRRGELLPKIVGKAIAAASLTQLRLARRAHRLLTKLGVTRASRLR